ncbi:unnamed protein product [Phaedon cochleariae]|uniref:Monocarboxylate transporter n=1 Tax=Phaedon cochleariae TaxID=80249 RepID=A0A9N9SKE2_PHACE|nr:unnamed protein product [Phaedon cochleariae]
MEMPPGSGADEVQASRTVRLVADLRQLLTLKQHYYPEGGWGWVVLVCAVIVHVLAHGMVASAGMLYLEVLNKLFNTDSSNKFFETVDYIVVGLGMVALAKMLYLKVLNNFGMAVKDPTETVDNIVVALGMVASAAMLYLNVVNKFGMAVNDPTGDSLVILFLRLFNTDSSDKFFEIVDNIVFMLDMVAPAEMMYLEVINKFRMAVKDPTGWLGAMSTGVALLISPVTIAFCRRKSTRVTAVMGGLITALGCLFTSFATQFHQLFFRALGWRLGLQVVTGAISITFILGTFYRSASLYHPQRRAILHIKNQKRKIKDKNKFEDKVPFFDFSTLKSKTVRILLISTGISAFGINTPLFYLAYQAEIEGLGDSTMFLQMYLGLAWTVGCVVFSTLVLHSSTECRIARQYLCQTAVCMCGLSILAFTVVSGNYHAYVMFAWIYGIFCGGYHYSLKMYTYERVRARNFARTWGFVQCSQAIPIVIGVPFSGYMNERCGDRAGYYFSSTCVLIGSLTLFLIDLHRRKISRHKHTRENGTRHLCVSESCPQRRKLSFSQEPDNNDGGVTAGAAAAALVLGADLGGNPVGGLIDNLVLSNEKPEQSAASNNFSQTILSVSDQRRLSIADMDLPDNLLDDLDYIGDCITSCNKVENYLMLSEFENNLIAEMPVILDRKGRRWSLARSKVAQNNEETGSNEDENGGVSKGNGKWKVFPNRVITVIDESSV